MRIRISSSPPREPKPISASPFSRGPQAAKSGLTKRLGRLLIMVIVFVLLALSLYVSPHAKVTVDSVVYHPASFYESTVSAQIGGLKDRSKISFDSNRLSLKLKKQFPEINQASVELPLFSAMPVVHLRISNPAFILQSGSKRFIINSQGIAVSAPSSITSKKRLLTIQDQGHFNLASGSQALSTGELTFISQVIDQCTKAKVSISSLVLPPAAQELDIHPVGVNYFVKFFLGGDPALEAGQYLAARHHFQADNIQPSQYLDVRVAGKIFYK